MKQQRALFITKTSVNELLLSDPPRSICLARAAALERQAALCDALFPWPALAESFRADADALRRKAGAHHEATTEETTC